MEQNNNTINLSTSCVRMIGVEPTCLAAPDPKSGASANFATSALDCKINMLLLVQSGGEFRTFL